MFAFSGISLNKNFWQYFIDKKLVNSQSITYLMKKSPFKRAYRFFLSIRALVSYEQKLHAIGRTEEAFFEDFLFILIYESRRRYIFKNIDKFFRGFFRSISFFLNTQTMFFWLSNDFVTAKFLSRYVARKLQQVIVCVSF